MRLGVGKDRRVLSQSFRAMRELLGLPQPAYARLFEVERALVQEMEEGQLPAALDQRLLKFALLNITLYQDPEFISALLREIQSFYGVDHIFESEAPILALFDQVLGNDMKRFPWIADSARFKCKAIERKRLGCFLMLWGENMVMHQSALNAITSQQPAFINFINRRLLILMPSIYLFLDIDTTNSSNPVVREIETRLERREPIGFALPKELMTPEQIKNLKKFDLEQMRLFAYSQDLGMLREAEPQKRNGE
jgi:hypothetical protein